MGKILSRRSAGPDDPIYSGGVELFSLRSWGSDPKRETIRQQNVVAALDREQQRKASTATLAGETSWTNPWTQRKVMIDREWSVKKETNDDGDTMYIFSHPSGRSAVVFGNEAGQGITLKDYVRAFKTVSQRNMLLEAEGSFSETNGIASWNSDGVMMSGSTKLQLHVHIVQIGDRYWRVVSIQDSPSPSTVALERRLTSSLWQTVR